MAGGQQIFSAAALAERLGGRLAGRGDVELRGVNAFEAAGPGEITFIASASFAKQWGEGSAAGAAVVTEGLEPAGHDPQRRALIHVPDAELAMAALLALFAPDEGGPEVGVSPSASIHETAVLGADVRIGPHVSVAGGCRIGDGSVLHPGVRLYPGVAVGARCVLHANCVVRGGCRIGDRVILHQNVSIGADGFGYRPAADGRGLVKMPHVGNVQLEDDVEIGAGSCVDRGKFGATVVGAGTKIDNLVQIAHNCRIGRGCVIAALTGIAGSVTIGDGVVVGGAVAIADHVRIGAGAVLGSRAGVLRDIPAGETCLGIPAAPVRETLRRWAAVRKLPGLMKRLSREAAVEGPPEPLPGASDAPADRHDASSRG